MDNLDVPTNKAHHKKKEPPKRHRELVSTLAILLLAPILALFLTVFVFQSYEVEGASMESTLHDKDRLIVTKVGRSWSRITRHSYIPDRYSVIVFNYKIVTPSGEINKQLIKRVIGMPGDRIVIKDGTVIIYNNQNPEGFYPDRVGPQRSVIRLTQDNIDQTIKENEVFVMGDNRGNSLDSRSFGAVKVKEIVGTLSVRIFPLNSIQKF